MKITEVYSRLTSLVLVIGIFFAFSCSSTEQVTSDTEETGTTDYYSQELDRINNHLAEDPNNDDLILEKAKVLENLAKSYDSPQPRNVIYQNIRDLTDNPHTSLSLKNNELKDVLVRNWNNEQSSGVELLQAHEDNISDETFTVAVAHFDNAITLIPDSTVTYSLLATTYYRNGQINNAIDQLKKAEKFYDETNYELSEKMAYLYLESGDIEKSIDLYEALTQSNPEDPHLKHGLANAYMLNKQHQDAVTELRALTDLYPTRYNYQESLATELFYAFQEEIEFIIEHSNHSDDTESILKDALDIMDEIESIFETLNEKLPQNEDRVFRMASTYKNASLLLSSVSTDIFDEDVEENIAEHTIKYLESSKQYWERLLEINPDNTDYYNNLYQVYLDLDMDEEAENIERSFNF